jgi:tetratricopeptide (TPR) repeat protein
MVDAVGFNQGEWAVAALHRVALAYADLAEFLASAPMPEGLSADEAQQYQQLVSQQVDGIRGKSAEYFDTCVAKARELKVFTPAVLGCVQRGPEPRLDLVGSVGGSPALQVKDELQTQLTQDPKDVQAIADLADFFLAADQPAKAKLMASRGLDIDDREARFHNQIGMAELLMGHPQDAYFGFERAAELGHPYAAANLVALMVEFGDRDGAQRAADDIDDDDLPVGAPDLHPDAPSAVAQVQ